MALATQCPCRSHPKLHAAGAETIVFDILFPEPSPDDAALAGAMAEHGNVVLPVYLSPPASNYLLSEQLPTSQLASAAAAMGHAHVELDTDGVARGLYLYNGLGHHLWPSLSAAATRTAQPNTRSHAAPPFVNVETVIMLCRWPVAQEPCPLIPMFEY